MRAQLCFYDPLFLSHFLHEFLLHFIIVHFEKSKLFLMLFSQWFSVDAS